MVLLLKTYMTAEVMVIPLHPDGSPRRGCNLPSLYSFGGFEGAYGNDSGEGLADLGSMADIVVDLSGDKAPGQL